MNKIMLIGNAGKDPEITTVKGDRKVAKFSLAVNEYSKNEKGEKVQNTTWFNCVAWDPYAETLAKYLKKGNQVFVEGRLSVKQTDKDGVKYTNVDVVVSSFKLLGSKSEDSAPAAPAKSSAASSKKEAPVAHEEIPELSPESDDLPF
jgi:single-strand DNA-binding protein